MEPKRNPKSRDFSEKSHINVFYLVLNAFCIHRQTWDREVTRLRTSSIVLRTLDSISISRSTLKNISFCTVPWYHVLEYYDMWYSAIDTSTAVEVPWYRYRYELMNCTNNIENIDSKRTRLYRYRDIDNKIVSTIA